MSKTNKIIAALGIVAGLGVAAMPLGAFAAADEITQDVEVKVTIGESISIAVNDDVEGDDNVSVDMEQNSIDEDATSEIHISTNAPGGYKLTVKDQDTRTDLVAVDDETQDEYTIPTGTTIEAGTAAWAIKGGDLEGYTAMVPSDAEQPILLRNRETSTDQVEGNVNGIDTTIISYGFSTKAGQEQGVYKDTIVFTATKNAIEP